MKLAIVGGGVSGLTVGHLLHDACELTLYEAAADVGGHAHTMTVERTDGNYSLDTGFVVYNDRTYPNFSKLIAKLGVRSRPARMSFSVRDDESGVEFSTHNLWSLANNPRAFLAKQPYELMFDLARFPRLAERAQERDLTLGEFLTEGRFGEAFVDHFVLPLSASVWSTGFDGLLSFPFVAWHGFLKNHGFADLRAPPVWRVIEGGSIHYVRALVAPWVDRIRRNAPVERVERRPGGVWVTERGQEAARFDEVVLAVHSDQALRMLADPTPEERAVLGSLEYTANDVAVHTDVSVLPKARNAWSSFNYHVLPRPRGEGPTVTYDMTALHQLRSDERFCVSLNRSKIVDPSKILRELRYEHPRYTRSAFVAHGRWGEVNGKDRIHYVGAYWGYGFHEDGVNSALRVARHFGRAL